MNVIRRNVLLFLLASSMAWAQIPGVYSGSSGSSRALPLPPSGRENASGAVSVQQSATAGGTETINSSIQVGGGFQGSIPGESVPPGTIVLTLGEAVRRGLETNLGAVTANYSARSAATQRAQQLSYLLPNISVSASETEMQINLAAYGFKFNLPPGINFSIPSVVGPFNYSQLQGNFNATVWDPVQRRNWQASKDTQRAAIFSVKDARELVVLAVASTYLQLLATEARVDSQRAQVDNARAVNRQAEVRKSAGTNARIDVVRTLVELETQQQRLNALAADVRKQKIGLARLIGLPLDRELNLSEALGFPPITAPDAESTIQQAFANRPDLKAAQAQVEAAQRVVSAARAERLPSASISGDYGVSGPNPVSTHGVFAVTGSVNVPIWLGGRVKADIEQAEVTLAQRKAELADQQGQVEQEVRTALIELETAIGQVRLGEQNRGYASETLREARDRFGLGVATTVEVVQAEEQVAGAESDYVSSLYSFELARVALARATGDAEKQLPDLLKVGQP
jgi:outer membrane protein TolC